MYTIGTSRTLSALPDEIWLKIFNYFSTTFLCRSIAKVCRHWYSLAHEKELWKNVTITETDFKSSMRSFLSLFSFNDLSGAECVSVEGQSSFTDYILYKLVNDASNIQRLSLIDCKSISDKGFLCLSKLTQLKDLNISICPQITDESIAHICDHLLGIQRLCLYYCKNLSDYSLFAISDLPNLSHLEIEDLDVSYTALVYMSRNLANLSHLRMGCYSFMILDDAIASLSFTNLSSIDITQLDENADEDFAILVKRNKNLKTIKLRDSAILGTFIYKQKNLKKLIMPFSNGFNKAFYDYFCKRDVELDELDITINQHCNFSINFSSIKRLSIIFDRQSPLNISKNLLAYKFLYLENLVELWLYPYWGGETIDQRCFEKVLATCKNLEKLCISGVKFSNSKNLKLVTNISIRTFSASSFKGVDELVMLKMSTALPNLCSVRFISIDNINIRMLHMFCKHCKYVRDLDVFDADGRLTKFSMKKFNLKHSDVVVQFSNSHFS